MTSIETPVDDFEEPNQHEDSFDVASEHSAVPTAPQQPPPKPKPRPGPVRRRTTLLGSDERPASGNTKKKMKKSGKAAASGNILNMDPDAESQACNIL